MTTKACERITEQIAIQLFVDMISKPRGVNEESSPTHFDQMAKQAVASARNTAGLLADELQNTEPCTSYTKVKP